MRVDSLTGQQILQIKYPIDLFGKETYKENLQKLNRIWHPDRNKDPIASEVMSHINLLALKAEQGKWGNLFSFIDINTKKEFDFKYKKKRIIDIGELYIGNKMILFYVPNENTDLFDRGVDSIQGIRFQTKMLETTFKRFIPRELKIYQTEIGKILTVYKGPEQIGLKDLMEINFDFKPGHVGWIVTGLYNFILFIQQAQNKMFGGLDLDSIFINTEKRGIHILGGWCYTVELGKQMIALPQWLYDSIPLSAIKEKKSLPVIDQIAIRSIAIKLLGDSTGVGSKLRMLEKKYQNMVSFLMGSSKSTTIADYGEWLKIEKDLPRLDIPINFNDVYQNER